MSPEKFEFLNGYISKYFEIHRAQSKLEADMHAYLISLAENCLSEYVKSSSSQKKSYRPENGKERSYWINVKLKENYGKYLNLLNIGIGFDEEENEGLPYAWVEACFKKTSEYTRFCGMLPEKADDSDEDSEKYFWHLSDKNRSGKLYLEIAETNNIHELRSNLEFLIKRIFMDLDKYCK